MQINNRFFRQIIQNMGVHVVEVGRCDRGLLSCTKQNTFSRCVHFYWGMSFSNLYILGIWLIMPQSRIIKIRERKVTY